MYVYTVNIYCIYICMCVFKHYHIQIYIFTVYIGWNMMIYAHVSPFPPFVICVWKHVVATNLPRKSATWQSGGDLLRLAQLEGHARTLTSSYKVRSRGIWGCELPSPRCQGKTGCFSPPPRGLATWQRQLASSEGWQIGFPLFFCGWFWSWTGYMGSKIKDQILIYEPAVLNLSVEQDSKDVATAIASQNQWLEDEISFLDSFKVYPCFRECIAYRCITTNMATHRKK